MDQENWIETTKMRKNLKKLMKKFEKQGKDRWIGNAGDKRREMKCKQKQEKRREKREGKEEIEEKSANNFISRNQQKCEKTRRGLNRAMPYNIDYTGLLIYINDK